jgi:CheY-like chemotaxis protein
VQHQHVARIERSEIRGGGARTFPDFAALYPGYMALNNGQYEATRKIKADPATQSIPVIALTAHAMAGDEQKAREAGCDDYYTKPIDLKRLLGKIGKLLDSA